ncbi:MAG: phosphate acyltransferase PlsX [Micavibrio sp.]|nr:phosphate acyltransferase PlsX [Micavibrio sp.]
MSSTIRIAIDAMGGDYGPESALPGAKLALKAHQGLDICFLIFGDEKKINPYLEKYPDLKKISIVYHTDKMVLNGEKPSAALRASKGTSMRLAIEAVAQGKADAVVSSGNTGALMAMAKIVLKTVPGIHRPAIASIFPAKDSDTYMLDLGANVLVDAENLVQFAVMGSAFAIAHSKVTRPRVGLLNVGTEDSKGPDHVRGAAAILSRVSFPGEYIGFVEGNDITNGSVDVVVSDGYAGNIALKAAEGVGKLTSHYFKKYFAKDIFSIFGALFCFFAIKRLKNKVDPRLYNGGVFLGLNGICVKSHGGCDPLAFSTAMKLAISMAQNDYVKNIGKDINALMSQETFLSEETL